VLQHRLEGHGFSWQVSLSGWKAAEQIRSPIEISAAKKLSREILRPMLGEYMVDALLVGRGRCTAERQCNRPQPQLE
jgi:hypothetical protein